MNKKILLLSIVIGILFTISLLLFFLNKKNQKSDSPPIPTEEKISIPIKNGNVVVNNYYKEAAEIISEKDTTIKESEDFSVVAYDYSEGRSFLISIKSLDKNPEIVRKDAENYFLSSLGITQDQACSLNVRVSVSKDVDVDIAGLNFGLSFCPNGKPFYKSN